jgi:serine/threonine-protein kinase HipA
MPLDVYVAGNRVGVLADEAIETGLIDFDYLPGVDESLSVSLTMPPDSEVATYHGFIGLPPPFEVSLPEGAVLEAIRQRLGKHIQVDDDLALLKLIGRRTIGRVSFGGPPVAESEFDQKILEAARSRNAADRLAEILRSEPHMFGVSGVMPKMATHLHERGTLVGAANIIKFDSPDFPGASIVEYACLKACERVGIRVPRCHLTEDEAALVIERFDLGHDGERLGFEDACALSGLRRTGKYSGSLEHLFRMIENFVDPVDQLEDKPALLKQLIMCDVLRNGDAHMKNFALIYGRDIQHPRLSPAFDVLTTQVWLPQDTPALPLRMDVRESGEWFDDERIRTLCRIAGMEGFDGIGFRDRCRDAALVALDQVLVEALPYPTTDALSRARDIVERASVRRAVRPRTRVRRPRGNSAGEGC